MRVAQADTVAEKPAAASRRSRAALTRIRGAAQDDRERKWRVQAVSVSAGSLQNRRSLPAAWRGLRGAELSTAAGIPGLVFVHASGFIGGAETQAAAVEMARRALAED